MTAPLRLEKIGLATEPPFVSGQGLRLLREDGVEFLDAVSGTFNLPLGYSHPAILAACHEQMDDLVHLSSSLADESAAHLLAELLADAPPGLSRGWLRDLTGSTANECAIKIAQKATGATDIISLFLSHHGQTALTTAISGNAFRRRDQPAARSPFALHVPAPYCHRCFYRQRHPECGLLCVERIADFIEYASSGSVACVIMEPILGNGGNIVPPAGYFAALRQLCDDHHLVLIADEVQTGLGRTGYMFGSEALGLRPDVITLAKGLGGTGFPLGAVLMTAPLDGLESHDHSFTSGGWLLGIRAARATLEILREPAFLPDVRRRGALLGSLLLGLRERHPMISEVRGMGMMWGLELSARDGAPDAGLVRSALAAAHRHRLILRGSRYGLGNVVKVRPSLIATEAEVAEIVERLDSALAEVPW
jgi:4-aminobutyrate aminotransferase